MDDLTAGIAKYSIFFNKPLLELICYIVMIVLTIKILMIIYRIASERLQNLNEVEAAKPEEVGVEIEIEFGGNNNRDENNFDDDMHSSNNHYQCDIYNDGDKDSGLVNIVQINFMQNTLNGDNVKHGGSSDNDLVHNNDDYDNVNENPGIGNSALLNSVNISLSGSNVCHCNNNVDDHDYNYKLPGDNDFAYNNGNKDNFSQNSSLVDTVLQNEAETEKPEEAGVEVDIEFEAKNHRDVNNFDDDMHSCNNHYQCDIYNDGDKDPGLVNIVQINFMQNTLNGDNVKHGGSSDNDLVHNNDDYDDVNENPGIGNSALLNSVHISLSGSNVCHNNVGVDNPTYNDKLPGDDDSAHNNGNDNKFSENPALNDPVLLTSVQRSVCRDSKCNIILAVDEPAGNHGEHNSIQLNAAHIVSGEDDTTPSIVVHENIDQKTTTNSNCYDTGYLNFIFANAYQNSLNPTRFAMPTAHHVSIEQSDHDTLVCDEFDDCVASDSDEKEDDSVA